MVVRDKDVIADKESMEEDLQRYISLNTYLECEDPWFWQKLRCVKCSFLIITHVLAESRSDAGKRKQYYALLKDRCLRRKYSPNVDKMLVESTGVLSFKFSESSRVQTSKLPQSKQSIVCDKLVPKDKQIGCKNCTNCFAKLAKLKSIEVCSKANCRAGLTETTYN